MKLISQIKIFLSSPADVSKERAAAEKIINEINAGEGLKRGFNIYLYKWEERFIPDWGTYQEQINKELDDTDIYVGIFWNKFGTPTGPYSSGTEAEFENTFSLSKSGKKIELCFYRCVRNAKINDVNNEQLEQLKKINTFFETNKKIFSPSKYKDISSFEGRFRNDILTKVDIVLSRANSLGTICTRFDKLGVKDVYSPGTTGNNKSDLGQYFQDAKDVKMIFTSGRGFIKDYEQQVFQAAKRGCKFSILVASPDSDYIKELHLVQQNKNNPIYGAPIGEADFLYGELDFFKQWFRNNLAPLAIEPITVGCYNTHFRANMFIFNDKHAFYSPTLPPNPSNSICFELIDGPLLKYCISHFNSVMDVVGKINPNGD